jgi:hypothetical protein
MFLTTVDVARSRTSLNRLLKTERARPNGNSLVKLNPFVDVNSGILYVGGRL